MDADVPSNEDSGAAVDAGGACNGDITATNADGISMPGHPHSVTVPLADIVAGAEETYTFSDNTHDHDITLSSTDFATLRAGGTVMVTSTTGGMGNHSHTVTLSCV
jgi:hypothetical protein